MIDYDGPYSRKKEWRGIKKQWWFYKTILKMLAITGIFLIGIHLINQVDEVMSSQRIILADLSDLKGQVDTLHLKAEKVATIDELGANTTYSTPLNDEGLHIVSLGQYTITHYCPESCCCGKYANGITATGTKATANKTIAVDPKVIPYGTEVIIDGATYVAEDCGGAIKGNRIDIYCDSHQEAINRGRIVREVFANETVSKKETVE